MKKIALLFLILSFSLLPTSDTNAGGCEVDAIYERNNTGHPIMGLYLRNRPCMENSEILKVLPKGEEVSIIAETDGWFKVRDKTGAIGWSGSSLMNETSKSTVNNRLSRDHFSYGVNKGVNEEDRKRMIERTRGYILLQVESHGEAWYIDPVSEKRAYMRDGSAAFNIMRGFGLGITNNNLEKLKNGDWGLVERLKGRIVLQVEENGEAFYIHPKDGSVHYLANGDEAYRIMRELGLGITNTDLNMLEEAAS